MKKQTPQMIMTSAPTEIANTPVNFTSQFRSPAPPVIDNTKPKFEPIQKIGAKHVENKQTVFKPTPVTPAKSAFTNYTENASHKSNQSKSYYYGSTGPQTTTHANYYTAVTGQPVHNTIATETTNSMHMKETTENSHRIVNISNTQRIISLEPQKQARPEILEPFPYSAEHSTGLKMRQHVPPPATPTKFIPGEFRDSDYDSELENSRINPIWTPGYAELGERHYRQVRPPSSRSASVPRSYERVMTPMEFDTFPVEMPSKIQIESPTARSPQQYFTSAAYRSAIEQKRAALEYPHAEFTSKSSSMMEHANEQINGMNVSFKNKANQFMSDVINETPQHQKPILKKPVGNDPLSAPQAYRDESRVSKYGKNHFYYY